MSGGISGSARWWQGVGVGLIVAAALLAWNVVVAEPPQGAPEDGQWPMAAKNYRNAYVTTGRGRSVLVIDTASDRVTGVIADVGQRPWGIGLSPDGRHLYTANGPSNDVAVIDTASQTVVHRIPAGTSPWGIAVSR